MQQKVPFSLISCSSSKVAFCSCVEWGWHIYNIVESESDPLTRRAVDLFEKEPLKGNSEVHLHTPTKFAIDDPSSNQFRDPPTYTHQPSMQQKVPFSLIRCSSSKVAFCSCVEWGWHIYNIEESESDPLTRRAVDLFEKEPLKGNSEVHLHTPTKFGEDRSKDLGGDREQTDRQTNRQTDKRCSIYSMIYSRISLTSIIYFHLTRASNLEISSEGRSVNCSTLIHVLRHLLQNADQLKYGPMLCRFSFRSFM